MNRVQKILIAVICVLSPLWVGLIDLAITDLGPQSIAGLGVVIGVIVGSPIILTIGTIIAIATRKRFNASKWFLLGYGIPALVASAWVVLVTT